MRAMDASLGAPGQDTTALLGREVQRLPGVAMTLSTAVIAPFDLL